MQPLTTLEYSVSDNFKLAPLITRFVEAARVQTSTSVKMEKLVSDYSIKWVLADHTSTYYNNYLATSYRRLEIVT